MRTSFFSDDTICAVATPPGMGAIAVVRVSGPQSHEIVCRLFHQHGKSFAKEQIQGYRCYYGQIIAPKKTTTVTVPTESEILDEVLVTFFTAPHSFTGAGWRTAQSRRLY